MSRLDPLARRRLHCHPRTPHAGIDVATEIMVEAGNVLVVDYRIRGDLQQLRVPGTPLDPERLWQHSCCELFVAPLEDERLEDGRLDERYVEWNVSPTGQVARFEFAAYRRRASRSVGAPTEAEVSVTIRPDELALRARVPRETHFGDSLRISLTAVLEDATGGLSYWAMRHPRDRADFHDRGGFALALTFSPSPMILDLPLEPA